MYKIFTLHCSVNKYSYSSSCIKYIAWKTAPYTRRRERWQRPPYILFIIYTDFWASDTSKVLARRVFLSQRLREQNVPGLRPMRARMRCWIYIRKYKLNYRWKFHASRLNFQGKNCKLMASIVDPACIFRSLSLVIWILDF